MAGADRAINMALRVQGVREAERDFKRVGDEGAKAFSQIERSANGAAREVSEYHARLKRVAQQARADVANLPDMWKGDALDAARRRNVFVLTRINTEKSRIAAGAPDLTLPGAAEGAAAAAGLAKGLVGVGLAAGAAYAGIRTVVQAITPMIEAFDEHAQALDAFNASLSFTGNLTSATRSQIEKMAERVSYATLQTEESVLKASTSLARVPGLTTAAFEKALDASARFADAMGEDVQQTAEQTATVLTALAEGDLEALVRALDGKVNPALAATIVQLAQAGKTAEAQQAYIEALASAAGDGPNGLATKVDHLKDRWLKWAQTVGGFTVDTAAAGLSLLERGLQGVRAYAELTNSSLLKLIFTLGSAPKEGAGRPANTDSADGSLFGGRAGLSRLLGGSQGQREAAEWRRLRDSILNKPEGSGGSGGGGKSEAQREAERLAREAESARNAADRVTKSNDDVIESYRLRAAEAEERLGLEGAALDAVERRQAIDAAARRLSAEAIEKEVAARRAEAAAAGRSFDEAKATAEATDALKDKTDQLRDYAAAQIDAELAQKDFLAQQDRAQALYESTRTPLERVNAEVAQLGSDLRAGIIDADVFGRRIHQLAEEMVDAASRGRNAWTGFGADVATSLRDITLNGGKAKDILREIALMSIGRLYDQNIGIPLANAIDGLTGNDRTKNVAEAESALAAKAVGRLGVNSDLAADAMGRIAGLNAPLSGLGTDADTTARALRETAAGAGQFGTTLAQVIASLSAGGGGGGLIGSIVGIGASLLAGGSKIGITNGGSAIKSGYKSSGMKGFAGGGDPPVGMPFEVGENGKEIMYLLPGGGARVIGNDRARSMGGGGNYFDLRGAVTTEQLLRQMNAISRQNSATAIRSYDRVVGERVQDYVARRG